MSLVLLALIGLKAKTVAVKIKKQKMKSFLLLLALTASVLTFSPIKTNDMAYLSKNLQASTPYENPWTADQKNGQCNKDEKI